MPTWRQIVVDPAASGSSDRWDSRVRPDRMFVVLAQDANHVIAGGESGYYYMHDGLTWHQSAGAQPNLYCPRGLTAAPNDPRLLFRADYDTHYLQYSSDRGITWRNFPQPDLDGRNVAPWVRAVPSPGSSTSFELYFGNGTGVKRAVIPLDRSRWPGVVFTDLPIQHEDIQDIAFDPRTHRPVLLGGDGGVEQTADDGRTWTMVGTGVDGLNALETFGLGVQDIQTRTDVSFITWHNGMWISQNAGRTWAPRGPDEGWSIHTSGPLLRNDSETLLSVQPWGRSGHLYDAGMLNDVTEADRPRSHDCYRHDVFFRTPGDDRQQILTASYSCEGVDAIYDRRATDETTWRQVARLTVGGSGAPLRRPSRVGMSLSTMRSAIPAAAGC